MLAKREEAVIYADGSTRTEEIAETHEQIDRLISSLEFESAKERRAGRGSSYDRVTSCILIINYIVIVYSLRSKKVHPGLMAKQVLFAATRHSKLSGCFSLLNGNLFSCLLPVPNPIEASALESFCRGGEKLHRPRGEIVSGRIDTAFAKIVFATVS